MTSGFVRLPYELIDSGLLPANELMVYIALLRHRDHVSGRCWPGLSVLSREARVGRRTVIRAIQSLEDLGAISVLRVPNQVNVYTVALFGSGGQEWGKCTTGTSATESLPSATESLGVVPESHLPSATESPEQEPITKTTKNELQEPALRPAGASESEFKFFQEEPKRASARQLTLLKDLYIHIVNEEPPSEYMEQWRALTTKEADEKVKSYMKATGRGDEYVGPEAGDRAYNALSTNGQDAADRAMIPDRSQNRLSLVKEWGIA